MHEATRNTRARQPYAQSTRGRGHSNIRKRHARRIDQRCENFFPRSEETLHIQIDHRRQGIGTNQSPPSTTVDRWINADGSSSQNTKLNQAGISQFAKRPRGAPL